MIQVNELTIDKKLPNKDVYFRRLAQTLQCDNPELYAPLAVNYLNVSSHTDDYPLNPLFEFDPRDYHRFRFKSKTTFLERMPGADIATPKQTKRVHQGRVPNFSRLSQFWCKKEPLPRVMQTFDINFDHYQTLRLKLNHPFENVSDLLKSVAFKKFMGLVTPETNYLSIYPRAVKSMLLGLPDDCIKNQIQEQALSLIRHYCELATLSADNPLEFSRDIMLIFEEIKLLLIGQNHDKSRFESELYYSNSGSHALSMILDALQEQKGERLVIFNYGNKYYEEPIALNESEHTIITSITQLDPSTKIDVLRMDTRSPANCKKSYQNDDILELIQRLHQNDLCSPTFTLVVDGTLNVYTDSYINKLMQNTSMKTYYFGSGVKTYCLGIDVATFGWIKGPKNSHLRQVSEANKQDNTDYLFASHLLTHCSDLIIEYQEQLLANTHTVYDSLEDHAKMTEYESNPVPYLEFFDCQTTGNLKSALKETLLRYRGSFGFPYPTWLDISNGEEGSIRVNCGLLTTQQLESLTSALKEHLGPCNTQGSQVKCASL